MTTDDFGDRLDDAIHMSPDDNLYDASNTNHAAQPGSQDAAQQQPSPGDMAAARDLGDDFDPQLLTIRQRVLSDSALWRASLPPLDGLAAQVSALSAERRAQLQAQGQPPLTAQTQEQIQAQAQPPAISTLNANNRRRDRGMSDETTVRMGETTGALRGPGATGPRKPARLGAVRGALAGVAAVVVVALLAGVLITLRDHAGTGISTAKRATPTMSPQSTPTPPNYSSWQAISNLSHLTDTPVFVSSDPKIVYRIVGSDPKAGGGRLQRSVNQGTSWQALPNPSVFPTQDSIHWEDIFVSPLNANTVYVMAILDNLTGEVNCPIPSLSGSVACEVQAISVDGGQHWSILTLPFGGRLGNANFAFGNGGSSVYSATPQAQGARLYSYADQGALFFPNGYHLATSLNGGLTWRLIDGAITAHGLQICRYAATPTGTTVFAVASTECDPVVPHPQSLWRSDDAGASWRQVNMPAAGVFTLAMSLTGGAAPTLYLAAPQGKAQIDNGDFPGVSAGPSDFYFSQDGGVSWTQAPSISAVGALAPQPYGAPLFTTLADGSIVASFVNANQHTSTYTTTFYSYRPGENAWGPLPAYRGEQVLQVFTLGPVMNRSQTLALLDADSYLSSPTYTVATLSVAE